MFRYVSLYIGCETVIFIYRWIIPILFSMSTWLSVRISLRRSFLSPIIRFFFFFVYTPTTLDLFRICNSPGRDGRERARKKSRATEIKRREKYNIFLCSEHICSRFFFHRLFLRENIDVRIKTYTDFIFLLVYYSCDIRSIRVGCGIQRWTKCDYSARMILLIVGSR